MPRTADTRDAIARLRDAAEACRSKDEAVVLVRQLLRIVKLLARRFGFGK